MKSFRYFGKYKQNLDGHYSVPVSGLLQTHFEKSNVSDIPGTMELYMHVSFVLFVAFRLLKTSF